MNLTLLQCFTSVLMLASSFSSGTVNNDTNNVFSENKTIEYDGYSYEFWKDNGTACITLKDNGTFSCKWNDNELVLFHSGKKYPPSRSYKDYSNLCIGYDCDYYPSGNSVMGVYGWFQCPLIEYYIVDNWGGQRPSGTNLIGTYSIDNGTYDLYKKICVNQPSINGTTTFEQYMCVRTEKRTNGTISVNSHFKKWEDMNINLGYLYETAFAVEGYSSNGCANILVNNYFSYQRSESTKNKGDLNGNGFVSTSDLIELIDTFMGITELSPQNQLNADIDQNNELSVIDIIKLKNLILQP